jgi:UDP-2,3-diacylglucosamine hydrolase
MSTEKKSLVFFAADMHLTGQADDPPQKAFLSFVEMVYKSGGDLYLLGDIFAFWANNRRVYRRYGQVLDMLGRLAKRGRVGFLHGNRDFLISGRILNRYGVEFLGEAYELTIGGQRLFLTHGDIFCDQDKEYQQYKKRSWRIMRILDVFTPGFLADPLAGWFRSMSIKSTSRTDPQILALSDSALEKKFCLGVDYIICGHVHSEEVREIEEGRTLVILPAWDKQGGAGGYAVWENEKLSLVSWPQ